MSLFFAVPFLLACLLGAVAAWRARPDNLPALASNILILSTAAFAASLIVAAEAASAAARYLGLLAVLLASLSWSGLFVATRRSDSAQRPTDRP